MPKFGDRRRLAEQTPLRRDGAFVQGDLHPSRTQSPYAGDLKWWAPPGDLAQCFAFAIRRYLARSFNPTRGAFFAQLLLGIVATGAGP